MSIACLIIRVCDWLFDQTVIPSDVSSSNRTRVDEFTNVIGESLVDKLTANGIHSLFPAQAQVIPRILDAAVMEGRVPPRDMCIASPTGKKLLLEWSPLEYLFFRTLCRVLEME